MRRGCFAQSLVRSPGAVALDPLADSGLQIPDHRVAFEVDVLVLHTPPEPLDEYVVHPPALPVHAHCDPHAFESSRPFRRRELAALVGVENLWQRLRVFARDPLSVFELLGRVGEESFDRINRIYRIEPRGLVTRRGE